MKDSTLQEENGNPVRLTAEELQRQSARETAPKLRFRVNGMRLSMAAKGFFCFLLDASFLYKCGGNAKGKIFISIKNLSGYLKHDKDSIARWRDELVREKLIWFRDGWPRSEWRITAICPAPETDYEFTEEHFVTGKSESLEETEMGPGEQSGNMPHGDFFGQNGQSPRKTAFSSRSKPQDGVTPL